MPITWRNVDAPSFRDSMLGVTQAGDSFSKALSSLGALAGQQTARNQGEIDQARTDATNQAIANIGGIQDYNTYRDTNVSDILAANPNADPNAVREAFAAQDRTIRSKQEFTPDEALSFDLIKGAADQELQIGLGNIQNQQGQLSQMFPVDPSLTPIQEVTSLADSQKYINENTDTSLMDNWFIGGKELSRERATKEFPKIIKEAHEQFLNQLPEGSRAQYGKPNAKAAQLALEAMMLSGDDEIVFEDLGKTYLDYASRMRQNDINKSKQNMLQNTLQKQSNQLQRNYQDVLTQGLQKIKGY